jgi:hypothetical protein
MITTTTNTSFIEAQQYSQFLLRNLHDGLLPTNFYRNVSDFGSGTTLNIKTIGTVTLQDITEDEAFTYNPIDSGSVTLSITDYPGDAWYVTDEMRQDGSQVEQLHAARAEEGKRAFQENFETRFLAVMNASHTASNPNSVNDFRHRFRAGGGNQTMTEGDLIDMRLAFDKANVSVGGRIAIVDPVTAAAFSKTATLVTNLDAVGEGYRLAKDGFDRDHMFVTMMHGWQIWTSNRLPTVTAETLTLFDGSSSASTSGVANIFMSIADDNSKPGMVAWRALPSVETQRDMDKRRDKFTMAGRFGIGAQRIDTLGVVVTSATATSAS